MKTIETLPERMVMRRPTMDDVQAVFDLLHTCDLTDDGMTDHTLDELMYYWKQPDFNLQTDAWCVVSPEGKIVGYADIEDTEHVRILSLQRVHPAYRGKGIEEYLLHQIEERAKEHISLAPPHARVSLAGWISPQDTVTAKVFEQEGFKHVRSFWRMGIEMKEAPQEPLWPEGVVIRNLQIGQDERTVFEMIEEAFADHWGHMPTTFEEWANWKLNHQFDPSLWFLAFDGNELAGAAICRYEEDLQLGWVAQLAVRRPWRRKGLGMALLLQSFGEFYRRGIKNVGLGVDSQNLTGATRLYTRAGMHPVLQHDTYEKELRAGEELSTQSITG